MLPEPTIPKPPAALSAVSGPWVMTPLFCIPDRVGPDITPPRPSTRRRAAPLRSPQRVTARTKARHRAETPEESQNSTEFLSVTAEQLRQALWRSFLRYGIPGDLDAVVHAALNVIEPVLQARDTEIQRLLLLIPAKTPTSRSASGRKAATGARRAATASAVAATAGASLV